MSEGLKFKPCDFHIHTPASKCFADNSITAKQIVERSIEKGLSSIAITDHNTGEWIDQVKDAAKGTSLTVFPGVEITVGDAKVHIIAIFDRDKTSRDISDLLAALGISNRQFGQKTAFSEKSVNEVIKEITSPRFKGLAVLAHADSSSGVLNEIEGQPRISIVRNPKLLAAELVDYEGRARQVLSGGDPNYRRALATYQASDNPCFDSAGEAIRTGEQSGQHSIDGIGYRYSYFKLDEDITLESLRQCFIDPDTRILPSTAYDPKDLSKAPFSYPFVKNISVNGGFLDQLQLSFHQGLNSILGAKGVGKSLLVEFMRFALDQQPTESQVEEDHHSKLESKLGDYGSIPFLVETSTAHDYATSV